MGFGAGEGVAERGCDNGGRRPEGGGGGGGGGGEVEEDRNQGVVESRKMERSWTFSFSFQVSVLTSPPLAKYHTILVQ